MLMPDYIRDGPLKEGLPEDIPLPTDLYIEQGLISCGEIGVVG